MSVGGGFRWRRQLRPVCMRRRWRDAVEVARVGARLRRTRMKSGRRVAVEGGLGDEAEGCSLVLAPPLYIQWWLSLVLLAGWCWSCWSLQYPCAMQFSGASPGHTSLSAHLHCARGQVRASLSVHLPFVLFAHDYDNHGLETRQVHNILHFKRYQGAQSSRAATSVSRIGLQSADLSPPVTGFMGLPSMY